MGNYGACLLELPRLKSYLSFSYAEMLQKGIIHQKPAGASFKQ